jgi:hypothetical protein
MWIISPEVGFFSIVRKPEDITSGALTVRARIASDLDDLRTKFLPELSPTESTPGNDYEFRARAPQPAVARAFAALGNDISYPNVKSRVEAVQGEARAAKYHDVWAALARLPQSDPARRSTDLPIIYASIGNREDVSFDPESPSVIAFSALRSREARQYSTCGLQGDIRDRYIARLEKALMSIANAE